MIICSYLDQNITSCRCYSIAVHIRDARCRVDDIRSCFISSALFNSGMPDAGPMILEVPLFLQCKYFRYLFAMFRVSDLAFRVVLCETYVSLCPDSYRDVLNLVSNFDAVTKKNCSSNKTTRNPKLETSRSLRGLQLFMNSRDAWQRFTFKIFQQRAATSGNVTYLIRITKLVYCSNPIAAANK